MSIQDTPALSSNMHRTGIRVLVVDDDVDAATGVGELLEMEGHAVAVAHNGTDAVQEAMMILPEIALVDLRLKGEWGLDVVQTLRGQFPKLISIIMTGESDAATVINALRQGVFDYLTKPFDPDQMIGVIERGAEKIRLQDEQQLMVDTLTIARDRAELASRSKSEFLVRLSRELGVQYGDVVKLSRRLAAGQTDAEDEEVDACAQRVTDQAERLALVTQSVLELDLLEAGKMDVNLSEFVLSDPIDEVLGHYRKTIAEKQIEIKANVPSDLPMLTSDSAHLGKILEHVISNAIRFSEASGTIEITAGMHETGDLLLDIVDHGQGMPGNRLKRALAPFGQLGPVEQTEPSRIGLGLTLAEKFTNLLGGRFNIESQPMQGTRVQLRFARDDIFPNASESKPALSA